MKKIMSDHSYECFIMADYPYGHCLYCQTPFSNAVKLLRVQRHIFT